jgi:hypothetical protein
MTFSEAVNKEDVQNYFRVLSTTGTTVNVNGSFTGDLVNQPMITIDRTSSAVGFDWSTDGKTVTVKTTKGLLANIDGAQDEARYLLDFSAQFRDMTGVKSLADRTFRFSASKKGGFHLFSVKNQDQAPYITDFYAINGSSGSDYLKIKFSRPMDVIGRQALAALLSDPNKIPPVVANNLKAYAENGMEGSTLLGFDDTNAGKFMPVYHVAKVVPVAKPGLSYSLPLNDAQGWNNLVVKSAVVDANNSNTIVIELNQDAFDANDKIVLSAGGYLSGNYSGGSTMGQYNFSNAFSSTSFNNINSGWGLATSFANITDPAGKKLDTGNSSTSANFPISNSQKVATAG